MTLHVIRPPSEYERSIFGRLMEEDFPGRDIIQLQLENCQVGTIDTDGSIRIHTSFKQKALLNRRVPVDACGKYKDGTTIEFILHVIDGAVWELEVVRYGGSVGFWPAPETLVVNVYPIKG